MNNGCVWYLGDVEWFVMMYYIYIGEMGASVCVLLLYKLSFRNVNVIIIIAAVNTVEKVQLLLEPHSKMRRWLRL